MDVSRRQALKGMGIGIAGLVAAARSPGNYFNQQYGSQYAPSRSGEAINAPKVDPDVHRHNSERAQHILLNYGPEAVENLGFTMFLRDSTLEKIVKRAGTLESAAAGAYVLSKTQYLQQLYDASLKLLHDIPKTEMQYAGKFSLLALLGGTAMACSSSSGNGGNNGGIPTGPTDPTKGTIRGNVLMKDLTTGITSSVSNSIVEFLDSSEKIVVDANVTGGNYETQSISTADLMKIARTRIRGKDGQPVPYLTREVNTGQRFNVGDNQADYLVAKKNPGIPELYDATNRDRFPPGLKRVDSDLVFYADPTGAGGRGRIDPVKRIQWTEDAVKYMYPIVTKRDFIPGITFTSDPSKRNSSNIIIDYDTQLGNAASGWKFDSYKLVGANADLSSPTLNNYVDKVELWACLLGFRESSVFGPSLSNNNIANSTQGQLQPVDKEIVELSFFDALGTQKQTIATPVNNTMVNVAVDSWEKMI